MERGAGAHLGGKVADADLHEGDGVADGLDVFLVVAGVPPAAAGVDLRKVGGGERGGGRDLVDLVVRVEGRGEELGGGGVFEVAGGGAEGVLDEVGAVALGFVEEEGVEQEAGVEDSGTIDGEGAARWRRGRPRR